MSYDEEQARRSRVVVETPQSRREYEQTEAVRPERSGVSATTVGILVVLVVALVTILVLLLMNNQSTDMTNANFAAQQPSPVPQTTVIEQPAQQPPIIIQQPAPVTQPAPIIVNPPAPSGGTASGTDDSTIQVAIDKRISDDPNLSQLAIVTTVVNGKATITGTVNSEGLKAQVERTVRGVRGVKDVDNQIIVSG